MSTACIQRFLAGATLVAATFGCRVSSSDTAVPTSADRVQATATDTTTNIDALLAASDLPPVQPTALSDDPMGVTVHRLSNGMTVYVSVDRQKPRYVGWIGVRAGGRMDPPNSTGLAHYLEHMLFKGTDELGTLNAGKEEPHITKVRELYAQLRSTGDEAQRKQIFAEIDRQTQAMAKFAIPNELSQLYGTLGVEGLNAFTSTEETVYIADIPSNRFAQWAAIEGERFTDPRFRLFYPELEAVYEEKNLSLDNPFRRVWEATSLALYPEHPYGTQTVIGTVEHLKTPAYQDMVDYFGRWYVPNNMAIVLAGDVDPASAIQVLEASFGHLEPKPVPKPHPGKIAALSGRVTRDVVAEGEEEVRLAWRTVGTRAADEPALAVMDRVFDDKLVGLLNVELELTQKLPDAGSWHETYNESGYFGVRGRLRAGQTHAEVEKALLGVIAKLKRGEFSADDVQAAKLHHSVEEKLQLEFPFARASTMMSSFIAHQPWAEKVERDKKFMAVTREDVIRVANAYLGDNLVAVYKKKGKPEYPKLTKPTITPVDIDPSRKSTFAEKIENMEVPQLEPEWVVQGKHYTRHKLPAGDMIAAKNQRNDLFSLTYEAKRGYRKEPLLCHALHLFELSGAGDMKAEGLQKELYKLGSSVSVSCDKEESRMTISGIDRNLEATLALVDKWLANPTFDKEAVERLYENTLTKRRDNLEEDRTLAHAMVSYVRHGKDSAWLRHPTNAKLAAAKPAKLRALMASFLDHEHRTIYFGPRDGDAVAQSVSRGKNHRKTGDVWTRKYRSGKAPKIFFAHKDGAKANVSVVVPRPPIGAQRRPIARLWSEYFSGSMGGAVFQEIREARGLAYSASAWYMAESRPKDATALTGQLSTQADKTPVALQTFLGLLLETPIPIERFSTARMALDQEYRSSRIDPRWVANWVLSWDDLGEPSDPRPKEWEQIHQLTVEEIQAFANQVADAPAFVGIVGDRQRVDLEALRKIAPVVEIEVDDLFSYGTFPAVEAEPKATATRSVEP